MLEHGGHLLKFSQRYQLPVERWLDLSTGVSPFTYLCPPIPAAVWNRLPELDDGLEQAAADYYGCDMLLAVAGSQAAIMVLPDIIATQQGRLGVVALPRVGYKEHQHAWQSYRGIAGTRWQLEYYDEIPDAALLARADVVVIINPNNPSAMTVPVEQLQQWQAQLQQRHAMLIVDEAFIDCVPERSLLRFPFTDNVLVLRSVGKFFGLAGARTGFIFGQPHWLKAIAEKLGPWTISGPSRWVTRSALLDRDWQQQMRRQLATSSLRLQVLLRYYFTGKISGTDLFQTVALTDAPTWHEQLCQHAVLTRLCDEKDALRFGLPGSEMQWYQLDAALAKITQLPMMRTVLSPELEDEVGEQNNG